MRKILQILVIASACFYLYLVLSIDPDSLQAKAYIEGKKGAMGLPQDSTILKAWSKKINAKSSP